MVAKVLSIGLVVRKWPQETPRIPVVCKWFQYRREHGKLVAWWPEAADELRERYQIRFALVGDCIATLEVAAEAAGYNQEMEEEFVRRFGTKVVNEVFREMERKKKKRK